MQATLRLVDTLGEEKEWSDGCIGYYLWMPPSVRKSLSKIIGHPVYSFGVEKEKNDDGEWVEVERYFVQTGERNGTYLLTFEIMDKELNPFITPILKQKLTDQQRQEIEDEYHRMIGE